MPSASNSTSDCALRDLDGDIHLDCHHLTFVDSSGLAVLLWAHERCRARGRELILRGLSPVLRRTLEITGLDHVLSAAGNCRDGSA